MTDFLKLIVASIIGGILVLIVSAYLAPASPVAGAIAPTSTQTSTYIFQQGLRIAPNGTTGTLVSALFTKSCSLIASSFTVAASTTVAMDCAVTGAAANDIVFAALGTTTVPAATTGGWRIVGVSASSTAGFDTLQIRNDTGTSAIIPAQLASSTRVLNVR